MFLFYYYAFSAFIICRGQIRKKKGIPKNSDAVHPGAGDGI